MHGPANKEMKKLKIAFLFLVLYCSRFYRSRILLSASICLIHLTYNPGVAGTSEMICATALKAAMGWIHRSSSTTVFNVSAPVSLFNIKSGVGIIVESDNIGFDKDIDLSASYSYLMDLGQGNLG